MRGKIAVVGAPDVASRLERGDYADVLGPEALPGADVVVLGPGVDVVAAARRAAGRAPGAAVVVLGGDVRAALDASLLPRGRVFGVADGAAVAAVEAVLFDRRATVEVTFVGLDGVVATTLAIVGAGGIRELPA